MVVLLLTLSGWAGGQGYLAGGYAGTWGEHDGLQRAITSYNADEPGRSAAYGGAMHGGAISTAWTPDAYFVGATFTMVGARFSHDDASLFTTTSYFSMDVGLSPMNRDAYGWAVGIGAGPGYVYSAARAANRTRGLQTKSWALHADVWSEVRIGPVGIRIFGILPTGARAPGSLDGRLRGSVPYTPWSVGLMLRGLLAS